MTKAVTLKKAISLFVAILMVLSMATVVSAKRSLDADLKWTDDLESGSWEEAQNADVFGAQDFEPGSEVIRYFKISNVGTLAFSYDFMLAKDAELGKLSEVIDVYYLADATANTEISAMTNLGTLKDVTEGVKIASGNMLPSDLSEEGFETGQKVIAIALKMQETASSEYMGLSLENGFYAMLNTTECDFEYPLVDKFKVKLPDNDFLYRVGNVNDVTLGTLFEAIDGAEIGNVTAEIESLDSASSADGEFKKADIWTDAAIDFSGEGPVKVTIKDDDYAKEVSVVLEVITANNVTSYGNMGNKDMVLLSDVTMSSNDSLYLSKGHTLYGNGFTFDVRAGKHGDTTGGYIGGNYVVCLDSANLDNVKLVGAVYTTYGLQAKDDYNFPNVLSKGTSTIRNSYISNCSAPVRVQSGTLEIKNTTLKGGNFANLDVREAKKVILDNVTTINQLNSNDTADDGTAVVGLGVLVWYENNLSSIIEVKNGITQYNHLSKAQANTHIKNTQVKSLITKMYSIDDIKYSDGTDEWVNTGILSSTAAVGESHILGVDNFIGKSVDAYSVTGYLRTQKPDAASVSAVAPDWRAKTQGAVLPSAEFDHEINKQAQTEGSNEFCYYNEDFDKVLVSFDDGKSMVYNLNILNANKCGETFPYTIKVDGVAYTNGTITFDQTKDYVVEYTFVDPYNYSFDAEGNVIKKSITYTKTLDISVTEVPKAAKDAEFKFYGYNSISKTPATTITDVKTATSNSGKIYIMPASTGTYVTSTTVDGITVNCPKVYVDFKDNSALKDFNWLYPVFLGVDIVDYADGGVGDAVTVVNHSTQASKPANFTIITQDKPTSGSGWSSGSGKSGSEGKLSSGTYKNLYGWTSGALGSNQSASSIYCQFSYKDNKGTVYYYVIEFYRAAHNCPSCVTGDTLITLADGSQKRMDEVTEEDTLLVWDFENGEYTSVNSAVVRNHGYTNCDVITLTFSDGTSTKAVLEHGYYNTDLNKFVAVNAGNVKEYIGHHFAKTDGNSVSYVELVDYTVENQYVEAYSILTKYHYNFITDNILSLTSSIEGLDYFMPFEIDDNMKIDEAKKQADIEKYGLFTYDELSHLLTKEQFEILNAAQIKVSVGKGIITLEDFYKIIYVEVLGDAIYDNSVIEVISDEDDEISESNNNGIMMVSEDDGIILASGEKNIACTEIIKTGLSIISATKAEFDVTLENITESEEGYVVNEQNAKITLTLKGASKGYAVITVDGDSYYTASVENGQNVEITIKNAKDEKITFVSFWGTHDETVTSVVDLGEFFIKSTEETETGAKAVIANTTKYDRTDVNVFVAVYNKDTGKLVAVNAEKVTVKGNDEHTISVLSVMPENYEIKAFVWDDLLKPVQ